MLTTILAVLSVLVLLPMVVAVVYSFRHLPGSQVARTPERQDAIAVGQDPLPLLTALMQTRNDAYRAKQVATEQLSMQDIRINKIQSLIDEYAGAISAIEREGWTGAQMKESVMTSALNVTIEKIAISEARRGA